MLVERTEHQTVNPVLFVMAAGADMVVCAAIGAVGGMVVASAMGGVCVVWSLFDDPSTLDQYRTVAMYHLTTWPFVFSMAGVFMSGVNFGRIVYRIATRH